MSPRRSAREIANELERLTALGSSGERDRTTLLHEVQVYQEELTVQNEELLRAQTALEESRDRFIDLYDFAPNGYVTLDPNGIVLQINLTGASMLGKARDVIEGMPILGFAQKEHRVRMLDFLRRCRLETSGRELATELMIRTSDGVRDMQFICKPRRGGAQRETLFTAMIDVTERRAFEAEREVAAREHAALAAQLISIQDEERRRIARDLHDGVGQQVTALRLLLDVLGNGAPDESLRHRIGQTQSVLEELDKRLDLLTSELRPVALDLGAVSAIDQFVTEWSNTFGIAAVFKCAGLENLRLSPEVETHLYHVVQEALNNIAKHAKAQHVYVRFEQCDHLLVLTITDDGCGFDLTERARARARARHGLGLVGMRERAVIINATIDVQSAPGRGTTITLRLPAAPPRG